MIGDVILPSFEEGDYIKRYKSPSIIVYGKKNDEYKGFFFARIVDNQSSAVSNVVVIKKTHDEIRATIPWRMRRYPKGPDDDRNMLEFYI